MKIRHFVLIVAAGTVTPALPPAQAQPDSMDAIFAARAELEKLAWLSGVWEGDHAQRAGVPVTWTEEIWTEPRGAMMLGINRRGVGLRLGMWEVLRIQGDEEGRLSLHVQSDGEPAVVYSLRRSDPSEVVFENAGHDYPQRIGYRRRGDRLSVTISRIDGGDARTLEFRRQSAPAADIPGR